MLGFPLTPHTGKASTLALRKDRTPLLVNQHDSIFQAIEVTPGNSIYIKLMQAYGSQILFRSYL